MRGQAIILTLTPGMQLLLSKCYWCLALVIVMSGVQTVHEGAPIFQVGKTIKLRHKCGIASLRGRSKCLAARILSTCRADCTYLLKKVNEHHLKIWTDMMQLLTLDLKVI